MRQEKKSQQRKKTEIRIKGRVSRSGKRKSEKVKGRNEEEVEERAETKNKMISLEW